MPWPRGRSPAPARANPAHRSVSNERTILQTGATCSTPILAAPPYRSALPFNDLCAQLSALLGGAQVDARNVRSSVGQLFGADASQKVQQFMQVRARLCGRQATRLVCGWIGRD